MKLVLFYRVFITNEFKSIIGKNWSNFWILFFVLLLTISALEFSRSGIKYLSQKMQDPFINWIEVKEQSDFERFLEDTQKSKGEYSISTIEANNYILEYVFNRDNKKVRVEGRTISYESRLLERILDKNNTISKRQQAVNKYDYGWIVTKDLMTRLGYDDENNYPLFINYTFPGDITNINNWGIKNFNEYIIIPIPIIAVVKQLPDLLDFITPSFFMEQNVSENKPYNISMHEEYNHDIIIAVENPGGDIESFIRQELDNSNLNYDTDFYIEDYNESLRPLTKYRIIVRDTLTQIVNKTADDICKNHSVYRIYDYDFDEGYQLRPNYLSFMFTDISKVSDFAKWSKEEHGIRIDMTQIETKDNFNLFNILAYSLCIAISFIALTFIAIFLFFLIDSHFHRISKNLGTIMAFGLSNRTIKYIYTIVFIRLILRSLFSVVFLLFCCEKLFELLHFTHEGGLPFISIADPLVIIVILILPVVSAFVIRFYLNKKLKSTPGDLIFERNN